MQSNDELHMLMGDYRETQPYPSLDDYTNALNALKHPTPQPPTVDEPRATHKRMLKNYDALFVVSSDNDVQCATTNFTFGNFTT